MPLNPKLFYDFLITKKSQSDDSTFDSHQHSKFYTLKNIYKSETQNDANDIASFCASLIFRLCYMYLSSTLNTLMVYSTIREAA